MNFSRQHPFLYCVIAEAIGLGAILAGGAAASAAGVLGEQLFGGADVYVLLLIQELIAAAVVLGLVRVSGLWDILYRRGIGFGRGLLVGMYFLVISAYSITVFLLVYPGERTLRPWYLILVFVLCMGVVGVTEELLFRGIIAETLLRHFKASKAGVWKAVILSGILFGAAHSINMLGMPTESAMLGVLVQMAVTSFMGMVFAAIYFRSGCIWVTVFLHGLVDVAAGITSGIYQNAGTVAETIAGYHPIQLAGCIPYLIVILVLLRRSKMNEILYYLRCFGGKREYPVNIRVEEAKHVSKNA